MIEELTDQNYDEKTSTGLTFTDFWATWCGPCRMQGPVIDQLAKDLDGKVKFSKVDVDKNPNVASKLGIMSIPTMVIKKNGTVLDTIIGYHDKEQLKQIMDKYIN